MRISRVNVGGFEARFVRARNKSEYPGLFEPSQWQVSWMGGDFIHIAHNTDIFVTPRQLESLILRQLVISRGDRLDFLTWVQREELAEEVGRLVFEMTKAAIAATVNVPFAIDADHLARQRAFSDKTFGPGPRQAGVIDHIRKELVEIETAQSPEDRLQEWVDVIILSFDGATRDGSTPQQVLNAVLEKQERNEARTWPDWRTQPAGKAIEHVRDAGEVKS